MARICARAPDGDCMDLGPLNRPALHDAIRIQHAQSIHVTCN